MSLSKRRRRQSLGGGPLQYVNVTGAGVQSGKSFTISPPADAQNGDLLVLTLFCRGSSAAYTPMAAGWSLYESFGVSSPTTMRIEVWTRTYQDTDGAYTVAHDSTREHSGLMTVWRNAVPDMVEHGQYVTFTQAAHVNTPAFNPAPDGIVLYAGFASYLSGATNGFSVGGYGRTYGYWTNSGCYTWFDITGGSVPARTTAYNNGNTLWGIIVPVIIKQG